MPSKRKKNEARKAKKEGRRESQKSGYYVEYLHFNNNGQLDGFLDDKNNMYVENNEYDIRKKILINYMNHILFMILCAQIKVIQF